MTTSLTDYLAAGLALVPIPRGEKRPRHAGWNQPARLIRDVASVGRLTQMNVGLAHAHCTPTATCALDIDRLDGARTWLQQQGIDLDRLLAADDALLISSGKVGSAKALYRLPNGCPPLQTLQIKDDTGMLLELRCASSKGTTMQDVLPPSLHPQGHLYVWANPLNQDPARMPEIPASLLALWQQALAKKKSGGSPAQQNRHGGQSGASKPLRLAQRDPRMDLTLRLTGKAPPADTPLERGRLLSMLDHINADCDYVTWRNVVWAILYTGWSDAVQVAYHWSMTAPHRYKPDGFIQVCNSFDPEKLDGITTRTLRHLAEQGGWHE